MRYINILRDLILPSHISSLKTIPHKIVGNRCLRRRYWGEYCDLKGYKITGAWKNCIIRDCVFRDLKIGNKRPIVYVDCTGVWEIHTHLSLKSV
jgi:hypothetical protein